MHNNNEKRKAELDKLELEYKSQIYQLNNIKKDEQIIMLEKANELDNIREQMEKALEELQKIKTQKLKAKESLKWAEKILSQRQSSYRSDNIYDSSRTRQCDSTLDIDTRFDIENTNPNMENAVNKFYESSTNVIFQSPVPQDSLSDNDLRYEDIESNEVVVNQKETPRLYNNLKRSLSRGTNRASQVMNPLTESYWSQNINIERYNSVGNLKIKSKKKKIRNSYRYLTGITSQSIVKSLKAPNPSYNQTEHNSEPTFEEGFNNHQKSTKMLIDCLMKQLNPITAYISDLNIKGKRWKNRETERSRNENSSSMFLDIQEKLKASHNNHLTWTTNLRASSSHPTNLNTHH